MIFAPPGADYTFAGDSDSSGRVAGHFTDTVSRHGFICDGSGYTIIDLPGATATFIEGMNDLGDVAGYFDDGSNQRKGFLKTAASVTVIDVPGSLETYAEDVNDNGVVVGSFTVQTGIGHSFIYEAGNITRLDYPGAASTAARNINNNGVIVGNYIDAANVSHGFIFDGASFTSFDPPGSTLTVLYGVNNLGHVAGLYRVTVKKQVKAIAFTYDGTAYTTIDIPDFYENAATGINDNGEVIGDGYVVGQQGTKGFLIRGTGSHPDLAVTGVSGPTSAKRGEYITVSTTIVNQGTVSTGGSFDLGIYLSTDATITTGDIKRATVSVADMAPGESRTLSADFLIQGSTVPGAYYLGAIADETNVVVESNEFNNALAGNTIRIR